MTVSNIDLFPAYREAKILKNVNPLAIPYVTIRPATSSQRASVRTTPKNASTYQRIGTALMGMLRNEYEFKKCPIHDLIAPDAIRLLKSQLAMYAEGKWPFNRPYNPSKDTPMTWWQGLRHNPDSHVLAVRFLPKSLV